jgi:hypothetical protein
MSAFKEETKTGGMGGGGSEEEIPFAILKTFLFIFCESIEIIFSIYWGSKSGGCCGRMRTPQRDGVIDGNGLLWTLFVIMISLISSP